MNLELITSDQVSAKPFLRWAGGKKWLTAFVKEVIAKGAYKNYHEPFLGGGAIFFSLPNSTQCYLSDFNPDLMEVYQVVRDCPNELINELKSFKNTKDFYYKIRDKIGADPIKRAARFIFLNQTSFNGIYRVNLKGVYNVPYGFRQKDFVSEDNLQLASIKLKKAVLCSGDFEIIKSEVRKDDIVFLDPPYTVSHNNNGFIKYNQKIFSMEDQNRLSNLIDFIKKKKAYYILSNAAHTAIADIFEKGDRRLELSRASLIGGKNAQRGSITEYLFTNCDI